MSKLPRLITLLVAVMVGMMLAFGLQLVVPMQVVLSQNIADGEPQILHEVYQRVNPSVPSITVRIPSQNLPAQEQSQLGPDSGQQPFAFAAGSGFVYDNAGHVVTNAHVVQGADQVELTFSDGNILRAKVLGIDLDSDLAVLQAQGDLSKYQPVALADSNAVQVGDRAIAIGNPFEKAGTMTQGIVSGLHRSVSGLTPATNAGSYTIPDAIQTDAALNPGNSGGPLLNSSGQVIGINEQIESQVQQSSGVSFAIPSNLVKLVIPGLIQNAWFTLPRGTLSRITEKCSGCGEPNRLAVIVTGVPRGPFSIEETCDTVECSVFVSFTAISSSPGCRPARNAGDPSNG